MTFVRDGVSLHTGVKNIMLLYQTLFYCGSGLGKLELIGTYWSSKQKYWYLKYVYTHSIFVDGSHFFHRRNIKKRIKPISSVGKGKDKNDLRLFMNIKVKKI